MRNSEQRRRVHIENPVNVSDGSDTTDSRSRSSVMSSAGSRVPHNPLISSFLFDSSSPNIIQILHVYHIGKRRAAIENHLWYNLVVSEGLFISAALLMWGIYYIYIILYTIYIVLLTRVVVEKICTPAYVNYVHISDVPIKC